ncbi:hypothetical protein WR25_00482 [Diploscapter pachys]|uniref:RAVE complex protein Rav1 C-terminal domain-containing protein n=1 Tax=Diploscapter pachys TaxID=2018661 RepID=A0A2A2KJ90_9BILA|nr:hypothetical protein WR25_00482 [Diploscapter pachys]
MRFWRCIPSSSSSSKYEWREWNMISDNKPSELDVDGEIYSVSAAHSGRIACAYDTALTSSLSAHSKIEIGVFECESSGGVEWLREDTLSVGKIEIASAPTLIVPGQMSPPPADPAHLANSAHSQRLSNGPSEDLIRAMGKLQHHQGIPSIHLRNMVRLDWVSTEDGGHILTAGIGSKIFLYTQMAQDPAQQNVALMKESETSLRRPSLRKASSLLPSIHAHNRLTRWVCTRRLELGSVDGLPPIPVTLSWARDGILIVGMQSEMRVFNQWNFKPTEVGQELHSAAAHKAVTNMKGNPSTMGLGLPLSASHSMLDQLSKKKDMPTTKSRLLLDAMAQQHANTNEQRIVLETLSSDGLFEASRLASPILPQYHPKQLIVLLNAGKTKRVKAILLHVLNSLKDRKVSVHNPLSRASSIRRMSTVDGADEVQVNGMVQSKQDNKSIINMDEESPDYDEIDDIPPLQLHLLMAADSSDSGLGERAEEVFDSEDRGREGEYDGLFNGNDQMRDEDLDDMLNDTDSQEGKRSRHASGSSITSKENVKISSIGLVNTQFTIRHNRMLTEMLTHTHLPGLSSVDQMHLLAIADTLSHFSSDQIDRLAQANAQMQPVVPSVLGDATGGYATATAGVETVDECGLRYLMAMKQHEYLLLCLPYKQKIELRKSGLSSSHIIWAQHSETETELLNAIPGMQKANPTWDELRSLGIAWWLKNTASLRICVEKLAKAAFQQNQDPMDASLFYLALKKKNVLTHLFKTSRNPVMTDFFMNDFNTEHWKKVAAKNAFVLMSKQRFQHAAAFFLLSGSLKDALQTILAKCQDLQLAMVVLRLFESDPDAQQAMLKEILCKEVLGQTPEEFDENRGKTDDDQILSREASKDPFERSMTYWLLKDYTRAAHTLVEEAHGQRQSQMTRLSDIFNFYSFLRRHPLVVRQKLTDAGIQVGSTEKFLAIGKQLESLVTPAERRLFFRTAAEHMAHGCPMLALDVLSGLPKHLSMVTDISEAIKSAENKNPSPSLAAVNSAANVSSSDRVDATDWSQPTNVVEKDELQLDWSDDEGGEEEEKETKKEEQPPARPDELYIDLTSVASTSTTPIDIIAQHLKFVACLRILTEELSTLASGFEVDGGQLRYQLFQWLEFEVDVLKEQCDYRSHDDAERGNEEEREQREETADSSDRTGSYGMNTSIVPSLHEAIRNDRAEMHSKMNAAARRRKWLIANQKLIRSFASFCALHSAQNHRLTSALMELLLLLLEVQRDSGMQYVQDPVPDFNSFPLLEASISSTKMFVSSPLAFIENQCYDLLSTVADMHAVPDIDCGLQKAYILYNLGQGLSACLYQSLCVVDQLDVPLLMRNLDRTGALTRSAKYASASECIQVTSEPCKWPGVDSLIALLNLERDDDAPHLRMLLVECFVAITTSLFCFALAAYDPRWLYRLCANKIDNQRFAMLFGGSGEKTLKALPPSRPPRPTPPRTKRISDGADSSQSSISGTPPRPPPAVPQNTPAFESIQAQAQSGGSIDSSAHVVRSRLNSRVMGHEQSKTVLEHKIVKWVSPTKNIVQFYADKPPCRTDDWGVDYDSDNENEKDLDDSREETRDDKVLPNSYPWQLMRLAMIEQQIHMIRQFLVLTGYDPNDIPSVAPRVEAVLRLLDGWAIQQRQIVRAMHQSGSSVDIIPNTTLDVTEPTQNMNDQAVFRKYSAVLEPSNTPFESDDPRILPLKRLWAFLLREQHLQPIFIRYLFSKVGQVENPPSRSLSNGALSNLENASLPDAYKIMQKDSEPIVAFACNQEKPGLLVVSNGRELQEMDISDIFRETGNSMSWLYNRTELDMSLLGMRKTDPLRENDDYQLFTEANSNAQSGAATKTANMLLKRKETGIRRVDSHPSSPFYVTGSSDGSIKMWKWGGKEVVYTARVAGQHAKVTKITFSYNGNKFAAVDGDGMLCLWQATQAAEQKKPFFSARCHNKTACDVRFLGHSASVLLTAGCSSLDQNLGLWDTLLPQNKALVHTWACHPEGAQVALYLPNQQSIVSGGRHGELCFWDIRQRQLRNTIKAFDATCTVKTLTTDYAQDLIVVGSSEGDIKIWSADSNPLLMYALPGEHAVKSGFSFRQVSSSSVQGVQQVYIDPQMRMFSCGADASLKFRTLPSVYSMTNLL